LGQGSPSPNPASCQSPNILITAVQFTPQPTEIYAKGYSTNISDICRDSNSILPGMKTITYLESMRARQIARSRGADEALFLNEKGYLAESSSANIFLVSRNSLKTPKLGSGILPGVTRGVIFELAAKLGVPCVEADILPAELEAAQEAFLTNSLLEIMPITSVENKALGSGMPGEITRRLITAYKELVSEEVS
jgi:branched-chain amino acid aminotransferase